MRAFLILVDLYRLGANVGNGNHQVHDDRLILKPRLCHKTVLPLIEGKVGQLAGAYLGRSVWLDHLDSQLKLPDLVPKVQR